MTRCALSLLKIAGHFWGSFLAQPSDVQPGEARTAHHSPSRCLSSCRDSRNKCSAKSNTSRKRKTLLIFPRFPKEKTESHFYPQMWCDRERAEKEREEKWAEGRERQIRRWRSRAGQGPDQRQQAWGNAKTSPSTANSRCSLTHLKAIQTYFFNFNYLVDKAFLQWNTDHILGLVIVTFLWLNYFFYFEILILFHF